MRICFLALDFLKPDCHQEPIHTTESSFFRVFSTLRKTFKKFVFLVCTVNKLRIKYPCFSQRFKALALYARTINRGKNYNPGQNVLGHLRKLGAMRHFAKLTHVLPLKKKLGMLLWGDISAVPFSPKKCWLCWIKTWMHNVNTAPGGRGERCHIFTSYYVSVPRVLTRVVGPQCTVQLWQIRGLYARKEATNNCFTNKTVLGYTILTERVMWSHPHLNSFFI